jgi:thioester reductase-like protein
MDGVILLTGATGLLGRYLLRDLSAAGNKLAVVVRPSERQTAEERVAGLLASWEKQGVPPLPAPHVLVGDITEPGLGLSAEDRAWVARHCDMALHNAASLEFEAVSGEEGEPWRSNLGGTRNVLALCREAGIADFHHVSTAYVCGLRSDVVREDELNVGQEFGNVYEQSKLQSETLVREAGFLSPPTVYRPAIIVGDSQTGFTTTFHGYYAVVRLAVTLARMVEGTEEIDWSIPLNGLTGHEVKNLVPVDWVSAAMAAIVNQRRLWGATYHLTPADPVKAETIREVIEKVVGYEGTTAFSGAGKNGDAVGIGEELASAFYDQMRIYATYWRNDPTFDRTNTLAALPDLPCPVLDRDRLLMLAETAIRMNFKYRDPKPAKVAAK